MPEDSETVSFEMATSDDAMIPQSILPPPPAARARDELSDRKCFQSQSAATGHFRPALRRRVTSVCRLQHVHELRVPHRSGCRQWRHRVPSSRDLFPCTARANCACHAREIQTQNCRSHIAMSHQLSFAWKASLTRTPPPICTSALGSQTALVRRASSVANE